MNAEKFWYGWLKVAAIIISLFGILILIVNHTNAIDLFAKYTANSIHQNTGFPIGIIPSNTWVVSVFGALIAVWGSSVLYLIWRPLQQKEKWAWNAIMFSITLWLPIDAWLSTRYGVSCNLFIHLIILLQFIAPLLVLKNSILKTAK